MSLYAPVDTASFVHTLDPRLRIVSTLVFALVVSQLSAFSLLGVAIGTSLVVWCWSGLLTMQTFRRLTEINVLLGFLFILMPLSTPGELVFGFESLKWSREGFVLAAAIWLKANTIMIFAGAFMSSLEPSVMGLALTRLGAPSKMAYVYLFMVRYLDTIALEYRRLRIAMSLRGFEAKANSHSLKSLGYLVGMLLVRTMDRADRISDAMKCRGFNNTFYVLEEFNHRTRDVVFSVCALMYVGALLYCEVS